MRSRRETAVQPQTSPDHRITQHSTAQQNWYTYIQIYDASGIDDALFSAQQMQRKQSAGKKKIDEQKNADGFQEPSNITIYAGDPAKQRANRRTQDQTDRGGDMRQQNRQRIESPDQRRRQNAYAPDLLPAEHRSADQQEVGDKRIDENKRIGINHHGNTHLLSLPDGSSISRRKAEKCPYMVSLFCNMRTNCGETVIFY